MATKTHRLPTKPLNPVSRAVADQSWPVVIAITAILNVLAFAAFVADTAANSNAYVANVSLLLTTAFIGCVLTVECMLRAKYSTRVHYQAGLLGALKRVDPAMKHKALPLYDAALEIMKSDFVCGGNEAMRERVEARVKKIRELSTANEAAKIHKLGEHDLVNASGLIEALARPAIEARQNADDEARRKAEQAKEEEAARRHQERMEAQRRAEAVEPDSVIGARARIDLQGDPIGGKRK